MSKETIQEVTDSVTAKLPKKSMFDILNDYRAIVEQLEVDEATDELLEQLKTNKEEFSDKVFAMYYILKEQEAKVTFYKDEISRLQDKITVCNNTQDRLKKIIMESIELYGDVDAKSGNYKLVSPRLNVTVVKKNKLGVDEESHTKYVEKLKEKMLDKNVNLLESFSDIQLDLYNANININCDLETACILLDAINSNADAYGCTEVQPELKLSLDKKAALDTIIGLSKTEDGLELMSDSYELRNFYLDKTKYPLFK